MKFKVEWLCLEPDAGFECFLLIEAVGSVKITAGGSWLGECWSLLRDVTLQF